MRIFVDMDGVIADFEKEAKKNPKYGEKYFRADIEIDFSKIEPMTGALEAVKSLINDGHDVFIASTAPWNNPDAWKHKRLWIEKYLPELEKKVFLTHRKDLLIGDMLIDDSDYRGQPDFKGRWLHFGKDGMDWPTVLNIVNNTNQLILDFQS
jgi:5'(3')-deoxyribonucleotidase